MQDEQQDPKHFCLPKQQQIYNYSTNFVIAFADYADALAALLKYTQIKHSIGNLGNRFEMSIAKRIGQHTFR